MNKQEFDQVGGFPMTTRTLSELQKAFNIFNSLGALAGDKTIISGCETLGSLVNDGFVYVAGEVFEFRGGGVQAQVKIFEIKESLIFGSNESKEVIKTRYVSFGSGVGSMNWSDFKRGVETKTIPLNLSDRLAVIEKKLAVFQVGGGMMFWNKPAIEIPEGWREVVDWRGRMPVGLDLAQPEFNTLGKTSGAKNKTLTKEEMPEHDHFLVKSGVQWGIPINTYPNRAIVQTAADILENAYDYTLGAYASDLAQADAGKSSKVGEGESFSIMNPYRVVLFIEYIL